MSKESIDARRVPLGRETKGMQKQISAKFGKSQQQKQSALAARRWALVQKMKGTSAAIALFAALAFATPAMAQPALFPPPNMTSQRLGDFTYHNGGGWNGTTQRLGEFGYSNFHGPDGQSVHCTSQQLGEFTYTNCH